MQKRGKDGSNLPFSAICTEVRLAGLCCHSPARNQGTKCRRAAPDRPMGGRFLTVLRFITHTPKIRNKVAPTGVPIPTRGLALPFVAMSHCPTTTPHTVIFASFAPVPAFHRSIHNI
tara:strand:- start:6 stop:356 length:351 start_codon:yes stop_codon:yes gene_type:complete